MLSTAFSSGQMTTYNVYQLKIHEFLSINVILREGYLIFGKFLLLSSLFVTFAFKRNSLSKGQFIVSDLAILS